MLAAHDITYIHPDHELLFKNLTITVQKKQKAGLTGDNGKGKSTLLKILSGIIAPASGSVVCGSPPYYVPQHFGQYDRMTVAGALGIEAALLSVTAALNGSETAADLAPDDWSVGERAREALERWGLGYLTLERALDSLSGGEKTRVFLAGILIHRPGIVLMDEPTNHLDAVGRESLYRFLEKYAGALLAVSHDRELLERMDVIYELDNRGLSMYGGNYSFYRERKEEEDNALSARLENKENALKRAQRVEREAMERKNRRDARGGKKQLKAGTPKIMMNSMRNRAENSAARLKGTHESRIDTLKDEVARARSAVPADLGMKMNFEGSTLHGGKLLIEAQDVNHSFGGADLWKAGVSFKIRSGDRISLRGANGCGKTTLLRMFLGELTPSRGRLFRAVDSPVAIDQDYSLIQNHLTLYEQAESYNHGALPAHEVGIRLDRFLFGRESWKRKCSDLSGGERMRLALCCMMIADRAPDLFILDEPTNNLDLRNVGILSEAVAGYTGTLVVVSHDLRFLEDIGVNGEIVLE